MSDKFFENYDKWLDECLEEFSEINPDGRVELYHGEDNPHGIEICEDGSVFKHGIGGVLSWPMKTVTPWEFSAHYVD